MALVDRLYIGADGIRMSKEGYSARNPPDRSARYLTMNSDWTKVERLHARQTIHDTNLIAPVTVAWKTASQLPFVEFITRTVVPAGSTIGMHRTHDIVAKTGVNYFYPSPTSQPDFYRFDSQIHTIDYVTTGGARMVQRRLDFFRDINSNIGVPRDTTKYDFVLLVFKRD